MLAALTKHRLVVTAIAGAVVCVIVLAMRQREPRFKGLPASQYVQQTLSSNRYGSEGAFRQVQPMGAAVAVPALATVIQREYSPWRRLYYKTQPHLPVWLRKQLYVRAGNQQLVIDCSMALGAFGAEATPAVPALAALFERLDGQRESFLKAIVAAQLGRIGTNARPAIPALLKGTQRSNQPPVRTSAIAALAHIDPAGERSAPTLGTLVFDTDHTVVVAAVNALGDMARRSPELVPHLRAALQAAELPVCLMAAHHMRQLHVLTRKDVEPFLRDVQSGKPAIRLKGASVLIHARDFAPAAVPLLVPAAGDADSKVRAAALSSLVEFAWDASVVRTCRLAAAETVLRHGDANQSWLMMDALPRINATSPETLQLLVAALENPGERTRGKAAQTLGRLGPVAKQAVPGLQKLLDDEWRNVREAATNALRAIEAPAG
jgi:HEAT repeat protein